MNRLTIGTFFLLTALCCFNSGCVTHQRAQNPLPGVFRVAVLPFNDRTAGGNGLDIEQVTRLFADELQRVPTFEVVPVLDVQEVLGPGVKIETNQSQLAYAVARAVHAQAVIVGDIVDYDPYYPPRISYHCEMYAMIAAEPEAIVEVSAPVRNGPLIPKKMPGLPIPFLNPFRDHRLLNKHHCSQCGVPCKGDCCNECQKSLHPVPIEKHTRDSSATSIENVNFNEQETQPELSEYFNFASKKNRTNSNKQDKTGSTNGSNNGNSVREDRPVRHRISNAELTDASTRSNQIPAYRIETHRLENPKPIVEPWMIRHSRVFDGGNAGFADKMKSYYHFREDERGGGWIGYQYRSEDFIRFTANRMIYEMMEAAGGHWKTDRAVTHPEPWLPWPWR